MKEPTTVPVSDAVFRAVYDSPASLPGQYRWVTCEEDVLGIEKLLGMAPHTINAPLWVSADRESCHHCDRRVSWLDIVTSALDGVHPPEMVAQVILGEQKYVNVEVPRAIEGLRCANCGTPFESLRSFKCHNWAYAVGDLLAVIERMREQRNVGPLVAEEAE
jgi:hypothetical protein